MSSSSESSQNESDQSDAVTASKPTRPNLPDVPKVPSNNFSFQRTPSLRFDNNTNEMKNKKSFQSEDLSLKGKRSEISNLS